jgi:solute carrier family 35 protein F1/2
MASTATDAKPTVIETHDHTLGNETYRKSNDGLEGSGHGNGSNGVSDDELRAAGGEEAVDGVVLEQAIETLEAKKTTWWAYLATKEFWLVLLIGYEIP